MATSWDALRRQAKQAENEAEAKLAIYSKAVAATSSSSSSDSVSIPMESALLLSVWSQAEQMETDIEDCLRRLTQITNAMGDFLENPNPMTPTNPSMMHVLQRHREILYDYSREFNRTKSNISSARAHAELLSGSSRSGNRDSQNSGLGIHDMMLNERNHIDAAHGLADSVLEQAQLTREQLDSQGRILTNSRSRIGSVLNRFPVLNNLLGKISTKKQRDQMIIAGVLGVCGFLLIWAMFR